MSVKLKKGYQFCGYYTNPFYEGKPVSYQTEYPMYKLLFYKIKYKLNGGRNSQYNLKKYNINTAFELSVPTKKLHRFIGWYDENGNKVSEIKSGTIGDIVLEAKWVHESIYFEAKVQKREKLSEPFFKDDISKKDYLLEMYQTELSFFDLFESKNNSLATADTILLTLASIFTTQFFDKEGQNNSCLLMILSIILVAMIMTSLGVILLNVIFKVGKRPKRIIKIKYNHHSISGIIRYSRNEFIERINTISSEDLVNDLAKQVYGLVKINENSQRRIRVAVIIDLIALVYFFVILIIMQFI